MERSRSNIGATAPQCAGGRRAPVAKRRAFGFTLVEAMVVVAVLAIIAAMAMPSFSSFVGKSGSLGIESDFVNAMSFARSEAMRRGVPVAVTAAASAAGNAFGQGWTVWVDSNANGTYDSGEPVLRQHAAYPAGISLGDGTVTQVYFNQQGYLTGGPYQFKACSASAAGPTGYQITALSGGVFDVRESVTCP